MKEYVEEMTVRTTEDDDDGIDQLLLVQSNLQSFVRQIDEIVVQGISQKAISREGRKEIESLTSVLSEMLSSLKPWVPRFQKVLSNPSLQAENELEQLEVESPVQTKMDMLISPSPLVSWRANCNVERGRQLFLLTPLPASKALSSKLQHSMKSVTNNKITTHNTELQRDKIITRDEKTDLINGEGIKPTPSRPSDFIGNEKGNMEGSSRLISSTIYQAGEQSMLLMTPCPKSPPKSCVLLEPVSEFFHPHNDRFRKCTPFPNKIHNCSGSETSESSGNDKFDDLGLKYPELLGIRNTYKSAAAKKDIESSPEWSFSPVKSCVLLEPPNGKSPEKYLATTSALGFPTSTTLSEENDTKEHVKDSIVQSTPLWKEPESVMHTGKRAGENTLKKELWSKFEAASNHAFQFDSVTFQPPRKKDFLDMLNEVRSDDEN